MNLNPFIDLINTLLTLYSYVLAFWIALSWLASFNIINSHHPIIQKILKNLGSLAHPAIKFIRRYIPPIGGVDISVIILFISISFIKNILYTYLYK